MLSSISWQHYLAAIIILSLAYYGYVTLRYYQKEISNLFNRKQTGNPIFSEVQTASFQVMGNAKSENGVSFLEPEDLVISEPIENQPATVVNTNRDIPPSQELEVEAGNLIDAFKEIDNKPEFITLLRILVASYKRYKDEIDLPSLLTKVIELSKEKLLFTLSPTDLKISWV